MVTNLTGIDRKVQASAGNHWQAGLPMLGAVPGWQTADEAVIEKASFNGCLADAARVSGLEDQDIAEALHISPGYMSRFMRGVSALWARRLVLFMRTTRSLAPLQWMAHQVGCELVPRDSRAAEIAELHMRLAELQGRAA